MSVLWLIALVLFSVAEAVTVGLTSIWFAAGALAALIVAGLGGLLWLQVAVFLTVSFLALVLIRPLAQKYFTPKRQATNADRVVGARAVVTREIDNLKAQGLVSVSGVVWTARSEDGQVIPEGATVRVLRIEGVKVFVTSDLTDPETGAE